MTTLQHPDEDIIKPITTWIPEVEDTASEDDTSDCTTGWIYRLKKAELRQVLRLCGSETDDKVAEMRRNLSDLVQRPETA